MMSDALSPSPQSNALPRGIYAIMVTPFNADLSIDWGGLRANVGFLSESEADVLVVLGSEGEFYALTDDERRTVVEVVSETVAGRKPLMAGVSHPSALGAAALARHAVEAGCDTVMTTGPYYAQADRLGQEAHVAAVAQCGRPVVLYNIPSRVGYNLAVDDILAIASSAAVAGVKQASPDIAELVDLLTRGSAQGLSVIGGAEVAIWPALAIGVHGNTATAASAIPSRFAALWHAAQDGDLPRGQELFESLAPLRQAYKLGGGQAPVVKRLLELRGLAGGPLRPPLRSVGTDLDHLLLPLVTGLEKGAA